jgi:hypothetical protein
MTNSQDGWGDAERPLRPVRASSPSRRRREQARSEAIVKPDVDTAEARQTLALIGAVTMLQQSVDALLDRVALVEQELREVRISHDGLRLDLTAVTPRRRTRAASPDGVTPPATTDRGSGPEPTPVADAAAPSPRRSRRASVNVTAAGA